LGHASHGQGVSEVVRSRAQRQALPREVVPVESSGCGWAEPDAKSSFDRVVKGVVVWF
jgi:hypothetical protein